MKNFQIYRKVKGFSQWIPKNPPSISYHVTVLDFSQICVSLYPSPIRQSILLFYVFQSILKSAFPDGGPGSIPSQGTKSRMA